MPEELAAAQRLVAEHECATHGHDFDALMSGLSNVPIAFTCSRCGFRLSVVNGGETHVEYRLQGQPKPEALPGGGEHEFPRYDFTAVTPEHVAAVHGIYERHAREKWTDVQFRKRDVTIVRTDWTPVYETFGEAVDGA